MNSATKTFEYDGGVVVRKMEEKDAAAVCKLWVDGLAQTSENVFWPVRSIPENHMKEYAKHATSSEGDVGPDGANLMGYWGNKTDRCMLVATLTDDPETVVGSVAVKKGMEYSDEEPEATVGSIWRMSVSPSVRRKGLGHKLMQSAESIAKTEYECTSMGLWTGNVVAAQFYCKKCGFRILEGQENWYDFLNPFPVPLKYVKDSI